MIIPLFLMWLASQGQGAAPRATKSARSAKARRAKKKPKAPKWPTPKSPPPIPAFQPAAPAAPKPTSADPAGSSTPLAELHNAPPALSPASITEPAKQAALAAFKQKSASLMKQRFSTANLFGRKQASSAPTSTVLVSQIQTILNRRGAKLVPDGLYGPRTASAWNQAARARNLPASIVREGPKIAKVSTQTFEALSAAPIP